MGVKCPLARVVPYVEIVVGILAALPWLHPWSALLALALLLAFTVVIVLRFVGRHETPVCLLRVTIEETAELRTRAPQRGPLSNRRARRGRRCLTGR